jgi:hypothetical protein
MKVTLSFPFFTWHPMLFQHWVTVATLHSMMWSEHHSACPSCGESPGCLPQGLLRQALEFPGLKKCPGHKDCWDTSPLHASGPRPSDCRMEADTDSHSARCRKVGSAGSKLLLGLGPLYNPEP